MKMNKRLLSLILVVVMVLGMIPLNAVATDENPIEITHIEGCSAECAVEGCTCTCHQVVIVTEDPSAPCSQCDGIYAEDGETVIHNPTCPTKCECTPVDGVHVSPCVFAPAVIDDGGEEETPLCDKCTAVKNEDGTITHETTCEKVQYVAPLCNMCEATKDENGETVHADGCKGPCKCEAVIEGVHSNMECPYYVEPEEPVVPEKTLAEKLLEIDNLSDLLIAALEDEMALMELTLEEINALRARAAELYAAIENPTDTDAEDLDGFLAVTEMLPNYRAENACPDCGMIGEHAEDCPWALGDAFGTFADDMTFTASKSTDKAYTIKDNDGGEANWRFNRADGTATLTIKHKIIIPKGQSLDVIVLSGDKNKKGIVKGDVSGDMFVVEGTLKIGYSYDQNYGKIELDGGTIRVKDGGVLYLGEIAAIKGNVKIVLEGSAKVNIGGNMPVNGALTIEGADSNKSLIQANEHSATVEETKTGRKLTANNKYMFTVADGGSISFSNVTVNAGAKWGGTTDATIKRGGTNSGLKCGFVYVKAQTTNDEAWEFNATNTFFQNAHNVNSEGEGYPSLMFYSNADAKFSGGVVKNCENIGDAGIIYMPTGKDKETGAKARRFTMTGTELFSNKGASGSSGVIRTNGTTLITMTLDQLNMHDNYSAGWGNILWNAIGECNITNSTFTHNTSAYRGGAISSEGLGMTITGCTFINNHAGDYGGAIAMFPYTLIGKDEGSDKLEMTVNIGEGCKFENNTAPKGGAVAIFIQAAQSALATTLNANINIGNTGYMKNNSATIGGGAIYAGCPEAVSATDDKTVHNGSLLNLNINSGSIYSNDAPTGGAVFVDDARAKNTGINTVTVAGGTIGGENTPNNATNGGAIAIEDGIFRMTGGTVSHNIATTNGGAVYVTGGNATMSGGTVTQNSAVDGAGLYVSGGSFTLSGGTISSNTATGNGGAAYITGGSFTMTNGTVTNNNAVDGGAAYVSGTGGFTMSNGTISNNTATGNGGAAYVAGGDVTIHHGNLDENSAKKGGAVYLAGDTDTTLTMESGTMNENKASDDGGAIFATSGTLYIGLQNCQGQIRNESGEVIDENNGMHTAKGSGCHHPVISDNTAADTGGGIAIEGEGVVHFYCGQATDNTASYKGVGMNVFMQGGEFNFYDGANVGVPRDPDLVIIGGTLNNKCEVVNYIQLLYYMTNGDTETSMQGLAQYKELMNLPDGEYFWPDYAKNNNLVFLGWTAQGASSGEEHTYVRNKEQYLDSGASVEILDDKSSNTDQTGKNTNQAFDGKNDKQMHLYALWAPKTSMIKYMDCMTGEISNTASQPQYDANPANYSFSREDRNLSIYPVHKPGYDLVGWYVSQDEGQNANWNDTLGDTTYEPTAVTRATETHFGYYIALGSRNATLSLPVKGTNFGNITLIAHYEPAFTTLIITKSGANMTADVNQSFVFNIIGDPENDEIPDIDMNVIITGNETATIEHLPVGKYTVEEISGWSWRYGMAGYELSTIKNEIETEGSSGSGFKTTEIEAMDAETDYKVAFNNTRTENKWLDGDSVKRNWFKVN